VHCPKFASPPTHTHQSIEMRAHQTFAAFHGEHVSGIIAGETQIRTQTLLQIKIVFPSR